MKFWKCLSCGRERETGNNIKIVYCRSCLVEMKKLEIKGEEDGQRKD